MRKKPALQILALILLLLFFSLYRSKIFNFLVPSRNFAPQGKINSAQDSCYLAGEVKKPGVYYFSTGETFGDLIKKAGGITEKADLGRIDLKRIVSEGDYIFIPRRTDF